MSTDAIARKNILALVEAYQLAEGITDKTVSRRLYGNSTFISELRAGTLSITLKKLDKFLARCRATWPANAETPILEGIFMDREVFERPRRK
jgi:hypothetical protein